MKTGNRNQAVILSVVALGAIAFLVIQLLPAKIRPTLGGSISQPVAGAPVSTDYALTLVGDPFSHPKLAIKPVAISSKSVPSDIDKSGHIPVQPGAPDGVVTPVSGSNPADIAGGHRQKPQGPVITVVAVVHAGTPVAMLEVAGKEARSFKEGDLLAPNARLISIGDNSVIVLVNGEVFDISTGDTYGSKTEETNER